MKLYLTSPPSSSSSSSSSLVYNCWIELARPIWCSKWPNSPGSEGSERKRERGGDGGEREEGRGGEEGERRRGVGLKTDQQPEDLNTTACLCCRLKSQTAARFQTFTQQNRNKASSFFSLFFLFFFAFFLFTHHAQKHARPESAPQGRRWIVRKSSTRLLLRTESR